MHICPVCESNDSLMNVPGVVARGTQRSQGTGQSHSDSYDWGGHLFSTQSQHTHSSTSLTDLAGDLSFPHEEGPGDLYWRTGLALVLLGFFGLVYSGFATLVFNLILIGGFLGASLSLMFHALSGSGPYRLLAGAVGTPVTFVIGASLVIAVIAGDFNAPSWVKSLVMLLLLFLGIWIFSLGRRAHRAFRQAEPERRRAHQIWQGLYYCSRDNVVLDPGSGRYGPPGALRELIHPA